MPRSARTSARAVALACCAVVSVVGILAAWNASGDNPRDGWSWARIHTGITPRSPSGDWAFHELRTVRAAFNLTENGQTLPLRVVVLLRRSRFGVFEPWLQTRDLELLDITGRKKDLRSGTADPQWPVILRAGRAYHARTIAGTDDPAVRDYHQRIVSAIDTELAGGYPQFTIHWGSLALDALFLIAHAVAALCAFVLARRGLRAIRADHRRAHNRCPRCGYDLSHAYEMCPECGTPIVQPTASLPE